MWEVQVMKLGKEAGKHYETEWIEASMLNRK